MSELKKPPVLQLRHNNREGFVYAYEVDEMNKYLSELDGMIVELEADYKEACDRLQTANLIKDEQLDENRHQKYKRCLNKAEWCDTKGDWYYSLGESFRNRVDFYIKWRDKWLKIADKFKEVK